MAKFMMLVFLNPEEGRDEEFYDWYENTHLDDVLRTAGFSTAQRWGFERGQGMEMPLKHLALYETEGESAEEVAERLNSTRDERDMSDSIDMSNVAIWIFSELGERHVVQ